jgi:formylglycine-generating enzyme required for sulfatase activity
VEVKPVEVKPVEAKPTGKEDAAALKKKLSAMKCPGGMKLMVVANPAAKKDASQPAWVNYCIDYHEYPGKGSMPTTGVSWAAAAAACAGQGKRLCTSGEWRTACGPTYSYGSKYEKGRCNTVLDGMEQPVKPAGSFGRCKSPYGLFDMVGNVAEWTQDKKVNGGDSDKTEDTATCGRAASRMGGSPFVGFRCCADPN